MMAPTKPAAPRRGGRIAKATTPTAPVSEDHRITKPATTKAPKQECSTCSRTLAASAFFKRLPTTTCKHDVNTCKSCLKSWITTQLEMTTHVKLSCPECSERLSQMDVKKLATKESYAKYDGLERRAFQEKTPGWRWCLAPGCRAGQVHQPLLDAVLEAEGRGKAKKGGKKYKKKPKRDEICICETCGAKACVSCDRLYHDGETCARYQKRVKRQTGAEEEASLAHIGKACKKCPKCEKNIEKNGGCDQVRCKFSFSFPCPRSQWSIWFTHACCRHSVRRVILLALLDQLHRHQQGRPCCRMHVRQSGSLRSSCWGERAG